MKFYFFRKPLNINLLYELIVFGIEIAAPRGEQKNSGVKEVMLYGNCRRRQIQGQINRTVLRREENHGQYRYSGSRRYAQ